MYNATSDFKFEEIKDYHDHLKKRLRNKLKGTMSNLENVLYFPGNIDVRICPKNAMSSLKWALLYCNNLTPSYDSRESLLIGTKGWRYDNIKEYGYKEELPFRKNSTRIAVARDPVKRFMSACEYMKTEYLKQASLFEEGNERRFTEDELQKIGALSDVDLLPDKIDEVIELVANREINNTHFYSQTYYYGNRSQYDKIFTMKEMPTLLNYLREKAKITKKIDRIHSNNTSGTYYGSPYDLTKEQIKRIIRIYEEDYDYGWTED